MQSLGAHQLARVLLQVACSERRMEAQAWLLQVASTDMTDMGLSEMRRVFKHSCMR
jgi:hypothetical protein